MGPEKSEELVENREATFKVHFHLRNLQDAIGENVLSCIYTDISIKKRLNPRINLSLFLKRF